ncbi:hypothetical protein LRH25_02805 [Ideonella azotifigens]|uniref:Uncharacterized protein n=1 Tax=Ideonella azotifigens TaxID=513160 RepID=A0ABP3VYQ6_9BURK|nr:hypothetical protein [Ideonella azotifigens]MCD2339265.1 hypothetical protein [Ideonella azotifigens]
MRTKPPASPRPSAHAGDGIGHPRAGSVAGCIAGSGLRLLAGGKELELLDELRESRGF